MAWLQTAPKLDKAGGDKPSRWQSMHNSGAEVEFPPNPAPFLIQYFNDIGPVISGDMGRKAIGWADIAAWQSAVGINLLPWQARLMRTLSREYIAMLHEGEKPGCPAPWTSDEAKVRERVDAQFAAFVRAFGKKK